MRPFQSNLSLLCICSLTTFKGNYVRGYRYALRLLSRHQSALFSCYTSIYLYKTNSINFLFGHRQNEINFKATQSQNGLSFCSILLIGFFSYASYSFIARALLCLCRATTLFPDSSIGPVSICRRVLERNW